MVKKFPVTRRWDEVVERLTPRQREVVILVGRFRRSYKGAAACLVNQRDRADSPISHRTVRQYATMIRDAMASDLSPRDALTELYLRHQTEFDEVA